jgi:hypothetical protein
MTLPPLRLRRSAARVAAVAGAAVWLALMPARGQENRPSVRHSHPAVRLDRRNTRISIEFTVPAGFTLAERPWIRIVQADGSPFLSTRPLFTQRDPLWQGYRDVNTEDFPAGPYRVQVEASFLNPQGKRETFVSPPTPLVVPKR